MLQDRKNYSGPRLCGTTRGSPLVLRTRAETWVFPHNPRPLVFFLSHNPHFSSLCSQSCLNPKVLLKGIGKSALPSFSRPVIGGRQSTVVQAPYTPRKLWCMGYPRGYSAAPRNTLGISHTPQLPWGLSITSPEVGQLPCGISQPLASSTLCLV